MLVCVLSDISFAVIVCSPSSLFLSSNRYLGGGATNQCESLCDGRSVIQTGLLPFLWR